MSPGWLTILQVVPIHLLQEVGLAAAGTYPTPIGTVQTSLSHFVVLALHGNDRNLLHLVFADNVMLFDHGIHR